MTGLCEQAIIPPDCNASFLYCKQCSVTKKEKKKYIQLTRSWLHGVFFFFFFFLQSVALSKGIGRSQLIATWGAGAAPGSSSLRKVSGRNQASLVVSKAQSWTSSVRITWELDGNAKSCGSDHSGAEGQYVFQPAPRAPLCTQRVKAPEP